jgi:group II intron reverse transcriptase/maturase
MAIKIALEKILDPIFSPHSYGFRPGRNQRQAVEAAQTIVNSGKEYVVDIDLSKFFDRINHDRLIHRLGLHVQDKRVLRLIGMILRTGIMDKNGVTQPKEGSVQGSPLSPLLSNLVLDELDKELEKRGLEFCRFADDCNIFVKSLRAGERVMASIRYFIEKKLKLQVNEEKSQVAKSSKVKFLGMTIVNGFIAISKAAYKKAMEKVRSLIPRGSHKRLEESMEEVNRWYTGWSNYFKMTQFPAQLASVEAHIRRRFRARFVKQCKRKRTLCKKLKSLGASHKQVSKCAWSPRKVWHKSHMRAVEQALSNRLFLEKFGQKIFSNLQLENWEPISRWVKLT